MTQASFSEQKRSRALIKRLVISHFDLTEARKFLNRLAGLHGEDAIPRHDSVQLDAYRIAVVVSYARPFSSNRGGAKVAPTLPRKLLKSFSVVERELHERVIKLRHKEFAHSDADRARVEISVQTMSGEKVAMPESQITRLDPAGNELNILDNMISKLLTAISVEWQRIEEGLHLGEVF